MNITIDDPIMAVALIALVAGVSFQAGAMLVTAAVRWWRGR